MAGTMAVDRVNRWLGFANKSHCLPDEEFCQQNAAILLPDAKVFLTTKGSAVGNEGLAVGPGAICDNSKRLRTKNGLVDVGPGDRLVQFRCVIALPRPIGP